MAGRAFGGVMTNPTSSSHQPSRVRASYDGPEIGFDVRFFWCCCCLFWTLLTIILVATSIRDVDYGYWGVAYNKLTCELNEEPFEQGKHVMRPETKVMKYNSLTIAFEFTGTSQLTALTADGLDVSLDLEIQYSLNKPELLEIVREFGEEEKLTQFIRFVAADSIRDVSVTRSAQDFYEKRADIEDEISQRLIYDLEQANAHITIRLVQLRNVMLPSRLMTSIEDKQRAELDIINAGNERAGRIIEANTALVTIQIEAQTAIIRAEQEANARIAEANYTATAITTRLTKRWEVWKDIQTSSGMTPTQFVNDYLKAVVISEVNDPLIGIRRSDAEE